MIWRLRSGTCQWLSDGLGYAIQSFQDLTDEPVFMEVKTT